MKPNEYVLTIFQLAAPIFCFSVGLHYQGWFLVAWLVLFGLTEVGLKAKTGKTLSEHVWEKPMWIRIVLSSLMIAGMIALGYHFIFGA